MLIICSGPDTFRAIQKAQELQRVFIEKYDKTGTSVDHLEAGKDSIDEVLKRADAVSLFSPRRFLRVDHLVSTCPKPKQAALLNVLKREPENVIVVSVEEELPAEEVLKPYRELPKFFSYPFPLLSGEAFRTWVLAQATSLGVATDHPALEELARLAEGNAWLVATELMKLAAGGESHVTTSTEMDLVEEATLLLTRADQREHFLRYADEDVLMPFLMQTRSALRVQDGASMGMPPFFARPWQGKRLNQAERTFANLLAAHILQRQGLGTDEEVAAIV